MFVLKLFRKLVKLIRGGAGPIQIIAGAVLGMVIGMTPGFNLTVVGCILGLLILNASFSVAMLGLLLGKVLCLTLAPVTFRIGYVLIHATPLGGLIPAISEAPGAAWLDVHYYCLIGGLPIALVLGAGLGLLINGALRGLRRGIQAGVGRSQKLQRAGQNLFVRILLRLLFGKQKKPLAELLGVRHPIFRKAGIILCLILILPVVGFPLLFADNLAKAGLVEGLQKANGAEVDVGDVDLSLAAGKLVITDLQVTDPDKPTHNLLQADRLEADVSLVGLLAKRFVIDKLTIDTLRRDVKRASPGEVFVKPADVPEPSGETLKDYFKDAEQAMEYLKKFKRYLDQRKKDQEQAEQAPDPEQVAEEARRRGFLKMSAEELLAHRPKVTIRHIEIRNFPVRDDFVVTVIGTEVSERPDLNDRPMTWEYRAVDGQGGKLKHSGLLKLDFTKPGARHEIKVTAPGIRLGETVKLSGKGPLDFSRGIVDLIEAGGTFNADTGHLRVPIRLRDVKVSMQEDKPFLGLPPERAKKILAKLTTWDIAVELDGPIAGPKVHVDDKQLLASLQVAMNEVGQEALAEMAKEQLRKIAPGFQLPKDITHIGKDGAKTDDKDNKDATTKPSGGVLDLLPGRL